MTMDFITELNRLCAKNKIALQGTLRMRDLTAGKWDSDSASMTVQETISCYGGKDTTGPFLMCTIEPIAEDPVSVTPNRTIHVMSDIKEYDCPVTGKMIDGRRAHRENLKRTGCRIQEPGEKQEYLKNKDRILEDGISKTVREAVMRAAHSIEV